MGVDTTRLRNPLIESKSKVTFSVAVGLLCLIISVIIKVADPVVLISRYRTRIRNGSPIHELLKQEVEAVHISAYIFNITNPEDFLSGKDKKLKVKEVGPFTYRELRSHKDMEIDEEANILRYSPKLNPVFSPEQSIGDPRKINVTMPNIALLTMVSMMSSYSYISRIGFSLLATQLGSKSIVTMPAHDYLWGYNESLITFGNTYMPGWIHFDTMGLMDRLYDKKIPYRLELGASNENKFQIKTLNGCGGLRMWEYEDDDKRSDCNSFTNAYEGIIYPAGLTSASPIRIYRNVLCRMLELDFKETRLMDYGPQALVYQISNRTYRNGPEKSCTCAKGMCIEGLSDISPCFYNLPLAISNAHFLYGGPELFERIDGLEPDESRHGSEIVIEPIVGAALATKFSIQVNIVIEDVKYHEDARSFTNMVLPVGYFEIVQPELPESNKADLKLMYVTGPRVFLALEIAFALAGILTLVHSLRLLYWNWVCSQQRGIAFNTPDEGKKPSILDIEVPLMNVGS